MKEEIRDAKIRELRELCVYVSHCRGAALCVLPPIMTFDF